MGGRPHILTGKRLELAQSLFNDAKNSPRDIAKTIGVSLATLYRYVRPLTAAPVLAAPSPATPNCEEISAESAPSLKIDRFGSVTPRTPEPRHR